MNADEAKILLSALREDECTDDPSSHPGDIAAACELMQRDPALKQWFGENCAFDDAVAEKCCQVQTPTDLETSILAGIRLSSVTPWWRRRAILTFAAAAVVALIAVANWWPSQSSSTTGPEIAGTSETGPGGHLEFRQAMISEIESVTQFDFVSHDPRKIDDWISVNGSPTPEIIDTPTAIDGVPVAGCKLLNWNGYRATLICFLGENDAGDPISFHLVAIDRRALGDLSKDDSSNVVAHENSEWRTVLEVADDQSQVLFIGTKTDADLSNIRRLL